MVKSQLFKTPHKKAKFKREILDKLLQNIVPALDKGLGQASDLLERLTSESRNLMLHFEDGLEKLSIKVNSLDKTVGSAQDVMGSTMVAPTLCGVPSVLSAWQ